MPGSSKHFTFSVCNLGLPVLLILSILLISVSIIGYFYYINDGEFRFRQLLKGKKPQSFSSTIPEEGGIINSPQGVTLEFLPDSAPKAIHVSIDQILDPPAHAKGTNFAGSVYEITSNQEILKRPVTLTLPVFAESTTSRDKSSHLTVAYWDGKEWMPIGGEVNKEDNSITVQVRHFSLFTVLNFQLKKPVLVYSTDHFRIIDLCQSSDLSAEVQGQRLESAWDMIVNDYGYKIPMQVQMDGKIQAWILRGSGYSGWVKGYFDDLEDMFLAYTNYDMYFNCNAPMEDTPAHELFHIIQLNSYLHPDHMEELLPLFWWMEATATWMGGKALGNQDYKTFKRFHEDKSSFLNDSLDSLEDKHRYRAGSFVRYLEDIFGIDVVRETWEMLSVKQNSLDSLNDVLERHESSLSKAYSDYAMQYAYLRQPEWLQTVMGLTKNTPEPALNTVRVNSEKQFRTIQRPHLSGTLIELLPSSRDPSGTLRLTFDRGIQGNLWEIHLFAQKSDGQFDTFIVGNAQSEFELAGIGRNYGKVYLLLINVSLNNDATLELGHSLAMPTDWKLIPQYKNADLPEQQFEMSIRYPLIEDSNRTELTRFNSLINTFVKNEINEMHEIAESVTPPSNRTMSSNVDFWVTSLSSIPNTGYLASGDLDEAKVVDQTEWDQVMLDAGHKILGVMFQNGHIFTGVSVGLDTETINYDLTTGKQLSLSDLFVSGSNYSGQIAEYCTRSLAEHLEDTAVTMPNFDTFEDWAVAPQGLLFVFDKGTITLPLYGPQYVIVPYSKLTNAINPEGPIGELSSKTTGETNSNSATPGFDCQGAPSPRLSGVAYAYISLRPALPNKIRNGPGVNQAVLGQVYPGDVVGIIGGPKCQGNYVWWKISAGGTGLTGWTAEGDLHNYWLMPCSNKETCEQP